MRKNMDECRNFAPTKHGGRWCSNCASNHPAPDVIVYGPKANGGRACSVRLPDGLTVLVDPPEEGQNEAAKALASRIADGEAQLAAAKAEGARLAEKVRQLEAKVHELRAINLSATTGRRRFFGPVLMETATAGDWTGEVWLMDPEKRERGTALRFKNLAEVREAHPELWVIGTTAHGILLDAWGPR